MTVCQRQEAWILLVCLASLLSLVQSMATPNGTGPPSVQSTTSSDMQFAKFRIPASHIFYRTSSSAAFVNLRPIVPGHVLIMPQRIVPTMEEMTEEEYLDLWKSVRTVQGVLKEHYEGTTAFNVAVQDGRAAGQSVPHVHVHILPRKGGDFERNDDVYDALEAWAPRSDMAKASTSIDVPDDKDRVDRTPEQMADEATLYRTLLESKSKL